MQARHRLILGGARSGKSAFAEQEVLSASNQPAYIATGHSYDDEMAKRVHDHQKVRDPRFTTFEEPLALEQALIDCAKDHDAILVDCLTLWITNLMMDENQDVDARGLALAEMIDNVSVPIVFVSNEVGLGIVPDNKMARSFRDHAGRLHQNLAKTCDQVTFVAAGLPLSLKGGL